jgi:outer membrane protein TolC
MIGRFFFVLSLVSSWGFAKDANWPSKQLSSYSTGITGPRKISLDQAESIALQQAPVLGRAYFDTQAAKEVVREARSGLFPQVVGDVTAVGTNATNIPPWRFWSSQQPDHSQSAVK